MAKYSKEILNFFGSVQDLRTKVLVPIPASADRVTPGDILVFNYRIGPRDNTQRAALIVRTKRGDGVFPGRNGKLVSCFRLNGSSSVVVDLILEELYKKRRRSDYYNSIIGSLKKLMGRDTFRTYLLNKMTSIEKFSLK